MWFRKKSVEKDKEAQAKALAADVKAAKADLEIERKRMLSKLCPFNEMKNCNDKCMFFEGGSVSTYKFSLNSCESIVVVEPHCRMHEE